MVRRLLLGCGSIGRAVMEELTARTDDLLVVDGDEDRVEALRDENVAAEHGDPADPGALHGIEGPIDTVFVAGDDAATNRAAAEAAREAFPDALLVVYTGGSATPADREAMAAAADRVVDHGPIVARALLADVEGESGDRLRTFASIVRGVEGRLGVFMHDNPDPDAIGSAIALREIARSLGTEADACYFGEISHQENRALVNLLDLRLTDLEPEEFDPDDYGAIALVDHSRPGVNDQLPPDTGVDIVIDHHPPREPVSARYVDLRSDVGATSTLLADYFRRFGTDPGATVATALLYGIRVDTRDFGREITTADFDAAAYLLESADVDILERVENPSVSGDTLDTTARAIRNRTQRESVLLSGVGPINDRDALAQAADQLLTMDGVSVTVVYGFMDGVVYVSARAIGADLDLGEAVRQAFGQIGAAGGHTDMAGAQIPLGILGDVDGEEASLESVVAEVIENRFLEVVDLDRSAPPWRSGVDGSDRDGPDRGVLGPDRDGGGDGGGGDEGDGDGGDGDGGDGRVADAADPDESGDDPTGRADEPGSGRSTPE